MRHLLPSLPSTNTPKDTNDTNHCWSNLRFYSNACHVCRAYGKKVELKRCSSCKMIAYCSREHQREDWPRHKELCSILGDVVQKAGSVFPSPGQVQYSDQSWKRAKANLVLLIQIKLSRSLHPCELSMLQFPRSCAICHETDASKLVDCTDCPFTSFCLNHGNVNKHTAECATSRLCFYADMYQMRVPEPSMLRDVRGNIPDAMLEAVRLYTPPYDLEARIESTVPVAELWEALASEHLTRAYTFMYAARKVKLPRPGDVTIHVVGADKVELTNVGFWETLLHHNESPERLTIVLVGPQLVYATFDLELCEFCAAKEYKLVVHTAGDLYTDYSDDERFLKPDYIVGFNLGIHEAQDKRNDTWAPSIPRLVQQSCPFFMTSYTLQESTEERDRLNTVLDRDVKFCYTGKNPFSSLRPYRDFESEDFFYENQYLTIYEKLC